MAIFACARLIEHITTIPIYLVLLVSMPSYEIEIQINVTCPLFNIKPPSDLFSLRKCISFFSDFSQGFAASQQFVSKLMQTLYTRRLYVVRLIDGRHQGFGAGGSSRSLRHHVAALEN